MGKNLNKGLLILLWIAILLFGYLYLTNVIEKNYLYPTNNNWFTFSMSDQVTNKTCIIFNNASISYCNDIHQCPSVFNNKNPKNSLYIYIHMRKVCDFSQASITIRVTNLSSQPEIINRSGISSVEFLKNETYKINLNNKSWDFYDLKILAPIDEGFFNYYRFIDGNQIGISTISFSYKNNILNGYIADENSFTIMDGEISDERPIFSNKYKWFKTNSDYTLIRFNPKSKGWFLFLKILDTLILGIIVILLYDFSLLKYKRK